MPNTYVLSGVIIDKDQLLSLEEFAQALHAQPDIIIEMIDYQFIEPQGTQPTEWRFDSLALRRARIAMSFLRELEINMAGVGLALELLDRIDELEQQLKSK